MFTTWRMNLVGFDLYLICNPGCFVSLYIYLLNQISLLLHFLCVKNDVHVNACRLYYYQQLLNEAEQGVKKSIIALSFIRNISKLLTSLPSRRLSSKLWPIPRHGFHDITRSFPLQTLLPFLYLISSVQFVRNLAISPSDSRECHFSAGSRP